MEIKSEDQTTNLSPSMSTRIRTGKLSYNELNILTEFFIRDKKIYSMNPENLQSNFVRTEILKGRADTVRWRVGRKKSGKLTTSVHFDCDMKKKKTLT